MEKLHTSLAAETLFHVGPVAVTNSMVLGAMGSLLIIAVLVYVTLKLKKGQTNFLVGLVQWAFEGFLGQAEEIIGDKKTARRLFPLAITMFFVVLATYWIAVIPGVGVLTWHSQPLFRGLPADLNFTFALAIITMVTGQIYAIRAHGWGGNVGRYLRNPFKDPVGAFEGVLEFIGEFSRHIALSFRLFGNAFAGEILLLVVLLLTGFAAAFALPLVMVFELFIGFIQAYVFFVLTVIFTSLAVQSHGAHDEHNVTSLDHSPADTSKKAAVAE